MPFRGTRARAIANSRSNLRKQLAKDWKNFVEYCRGDSSSVGMTNCTCIKLRNALPNRKPKPNSVQVFYRNALLVC